MEWSKRFQTRWTCPHCNTQGWLTNGQTFDPRRDHARPDGRACLASNWLDGLRGIDIDLPDECAADLTAGGRDCEPEAREWIKDPAIAAQLDAIGTWQGASLDEAKAKAAQHIRAVSDGREEREAAEEAAEAGESASEAE